MACIFYNKDFLFLANVEISFKSTILPPRCTTTMALTGFEALLIASFICFSVAKPIFYRNQKKLSRHLKLNALAVARKVIDGTITEWFELIFKDFAIKYKADVPELTAREYGTER